MSGVSPTTAVADHSPRGPGASWIAVSRQELGFVAQLVPGRAVAPIYISAQSKRRGFLLTGKSHALDSVRSRQSKGSPRRRREAQNAPFHARRPTRSEEHTSELQSPCNLVCRLLLEKKKKGLHTAPSAAAAPSHALWAARTPRFRRTSGRRTRPPTTLTRRRRRTCPPWSRSTRRTRI